MTDTITLDLWLNVYPNRVEAHLSREAADLNAWNNRVACVNHQKTVTVGEGLQQSEGA